MPRLRALFPILPLAFVFAVTSAARAQEQRGAAPEMFDVQGSNPGSAKTDYTGTIAIARSGDTWHMIWRIGNATYRGTGFIIDAQVLGATGMIQGRPFIVLMKKDGNRYVGQWTVLGSDKLGRETWTPRQ